MKKYLVFVLSLFIVFISSVNIFAETTPKKGEVNDKVKKSLKVRKKTNTKSEVLCKLKIGTKVDILKEEGKWYKIEANQTKGWVKKKFIKVTYYGDSITRLLSVKSNNGKNKKKKKANKNISATKCKVNKNVKNDNSDKKNQ